MALHDGKKMYVRCERVSVFDAICYPCCDLSALACRLVKSSFLTDDQVKILELMGFQIECENEFNTQNNGD